MGLRILVTGGAGFIGSAVVPAMQAAGHRVAVFDNLSFGSRAFVSVADGDFFEGDIRHADGLERAFFQFKPQCVIHLAAIHFIPYCNEHPFEASDVNIRGTLNVLNACRKQVTVRQLLFASTAAVYPISDEAVSEEHPAHPLDIYGLSKLAGERLCREYHLETGVPTVIARFFNAFGPNETNPHLIPEIERQIKAGQRTIRLGNLTPQRDFIHTSDMASAMLAMLGLGHAGYDIFNLGRGIEYSVTEIVAAFERQLGEAIAIEVDPARVRKTERMHLLANVDKLKAATGWEPLRSIDEGIADLLSNR